MEDRPVVDAGLESVTDRLNQPKSAEANSVNWKHNGSFPRFRIQNWTVSLWPRIFTFFMFSFLGQ